MANLPPEEIPWQNFPRGEIIPYGKPSPSLANLLQHKFPYMILGQHVRFILGGGGGGNLIDGELLPYGILSGGKEIHMGRKSHVTSDAPVAT